MCVLVCGVWSLKKARLRCDRLCWWPLNFNTLHNYTCIKIDKVYPSQKWWDITELLVHPASLDMGGAPPHTNHRIRQAARGEEQVGLLKNNAPVANDALSRLSGTWRDALSRLSGTWRDALLTLSWTWLDSWRLTLVALSLEHLWSCARNFASTPTKPTIYSKAKDRRHNIKEQRIERLQTKGKPSVTSRGSIHISRVSTREHPETHEPPTWFPRTKTRATHLKETKPKSSLL